MLASFLLPVGYSMPLPRFETETTVVARALFERLLSNFPLKETIHTHELAPACGLEVSTRIDAYDNEIHIAADFPSGADMDKLLHDLLLWLSSEGYIICGDMLHYSVVLSEKGLELLGYKPPFLDSLR